VFLIHNYEIMLANGDRVYYNTDMPFEDFKKMISENEWLEIEREPWVSIPNGWSRRPPKASYQTKSIVYVNWDQELEEARKEWARKLEQQRPIKDEILSYIPNWRIKWKYKWSYGRIWNEDGYWDEDKSLYQIGFTDEFLEGVLADCKKYKCKKRS
jgi:hypothetical protein